MSKLVPLGDHLVVKPLAKEKQTASGIFIPDTTHEKPEQGEVIAVGNGRKNEKGELMPMEVAVGDKVLFKKYAPDECEIEGEKLLVLSEADILAKIV